MADEILSKSLDVENIPEYPIEIIEDGNEYKPLEIQESSSGIKPIEQDKDISNDYTNVRKNLKTLIEKSSQAADSALNLAEESDAPRAYEVLGLLLKTALEANSELMALHDKMQKLERHQENNNPTINTNGGNVNIIQTNTTDLLEALKQNDNPKNK